MVGLFGLYSTNGCCYDVIVSGLKHVMLHSGHAKLTKTDGKVVSHGGASVALIFCKHFVVLFAKRILPLRFPFESEQ